LAVADAIFSCVPNFAATTEKGTHLRRFAPIFSAAAIVLLAAFAHAQQLDLAVTGSTLMAFKNTSDSEAFVPAPEKGGVYPGVSADYIFHGRLGLNVETSWRYHRANYYGYEKYRPVFTDVNAIFQPKITKKFGLDFMGGVGVASNLFYLPGNQCFAGGGSCYSNGEHFMEHLSAGVRYYAWHHFFIRPEANYYRIQNNFEFRSDNVFRVGASIGYTFTEK
jgi:hypothetical protein